MGKLLLGIGAVLLVASIVAFWYSYDTSIALLIIGIVGHRVSYGEVRNE